MTKQVLVELGERSYPIVIGQNLLSNGEPLARYLKNRNILIVTNETIAPLYLEKVQAMLSDFNCVTPVI